LHIKQTQLPKPTNSYLINKPTPPFPSLSIHRLHYLLQLKAVVCITRNNFSFNSQYPVGAIFVVYQLRQITRPDMFMGNMWRLVLALCVLSSVVVTSSAQTCRNQTFSNRLFATCRDLPQLTAYLHWTYEQASGKLEIAFVHAGISSTNRWVAWAINPRNTLDPAMIGAQALVAIPQSSGSPRVYTSSIASTSTQLEEGAISYPVSGLGATFENNQVTIFATVTLPNDTSSIVHVWQDGPLSGTTPQEHSHETSHQNSKETLDLLSGSSTQASGNSRQRRRNVSIKHQSLLMFSIISYMASHL